MAIFAGARTLSSTAGYFLAISIVMALSLNIDLTLISSFASAREAADYGVPWRAYSQLGLMLSLISIPFWSAAGAALSAGHTQWVAKRVRLLATLNLAVMAPAALIGVVLGPRLIQLWVGTSIDIDRIALAGFGAWWCVMAVMYPMFMVQNGAGVLRPQLVGWCSFLLLSSVLKVLALEAGSWIWLPTIATGCYLVTLLPAAVIGYRRALRSAAADANAPASATV